MRLANGSSKRGSGGLLPFLEGCKLSNRPLGISPVVWCHSDLDNIVFGIGAQSLSAAATTPLCILFAVPEHEMKTFHGRQWPGHPDLAMV